jgi:hypothetical protein
LSESIYIKDYCGTIKGAGKGKTIIQPISPFKAKKDPYLNISGTEVTAIFAFFNPVCDITVRDMTFDIVGETPAELHNNPFHGELRTIDNVIVVSEGVDVEITASFRNLEVNGLRTNGFQYIYNRSNLIYGLLVTGMNSTIPVNMIVENCDINHTGLAAILYSKGNGGTATINNNYIGNSNHCGIWLNYLEECEIKITNNRFENIMLDQAILDHDTASKCCILDNSLDGVAMVDNCPK